MKLFEIKKNLIDIFPINFLNIRTSSFWYNYILIFENLSINVLTSKMRRNTKLKNYFSGPINITLYATNSALLEKYSINSSFYFKTLNTLIILESQQLTFNDLIIAFQVDYRKYILG